MVDIEKLRNEFRELDRVWNGRLCTCQVSLDEGNAIFDEIDRLKDKLEDAQGNLNPDRIAKSVGLPMMYGYKGSSNTRLLLLECETGDIHLITDYGETIAVVRTGTELMSLLKQVANNEYA